jgi:hypothetical protein
VPERLIRDEAEREQLAGQIAQMGQNGIDTSQITGA